MPRLDDCACSRCGAPIGSGEYKLPAHRGSGNADDREPEHPVDWLCRVCVIRHIISDFDDDAEDE